jgi:hypothetical protein
MRCKQPGCCVEVACAKKALLAHAVFLSDQLSAFSEPVLPERPLAAPAMALIDAAAITLPTGRLAPALPALGGR